MDKKPWFEYSRNNDGSSKIKIRWPLILLVVIILVWACWF